MCAIKLHLVSPKPIADVVRDGPVSGALATIAELAGAEFHLSGDAGRPGDGAHDAAGRVPLRYHGQSLGHVRVDANGSTQSVTAATQALASILEYALDRELAIDDLAEEMIASYEELNMLYALLPNIATSVSPTAIGEAIVDETVRTLHCRRVSLLVLDDTRNFMHVLASRGLPPDVRNVTMPVAGSISERVLTGGNPLIVNRLSDHPDLSELSRGQYDTGSFAVVRVTLRARGESLGVLTATERCDSVEFTARDRKLLEGLAAIGATALLNCRLHNAANRQMLSTIRALASAIDAKDRYTHAHSARVAQLAVATARELGLRDAESLREVELAGLLHDIGKIGISDTLLSKAGRLTSEEYAMVQQHAEIGARIVEHVPGLERVARAIHHHHERFDGLGYPHGLNGENIPQAARLIAVVDVFDCLTSDRAYRRAVPREAAILELVRARGTQLDATMVDAFIGVLNTAPFQRLGAKYEKVEPEPAPC
jgi:putative nucleotidyltransferase with HDIG domain